MDEGHRPSSQASSKGNEERATAAGDEMSASSTGRGEQDLGDERATATNPKTTAQHSDHEAEQQHELGQEEAEALREEESQLDLELRAIGKMRLAFEVSLQMFEAVRDDLEEMGRRIDRLAAASGRCRQALRDKTEREA
jgi:hypothetical protein